MSVTGTLDKDWIDLNASYVTNRIGRFSLFDTTDRFYEDLACLGLPGAPDALPPASVLRIFHHAGLAPIPVRFAAGMKNAGEFEFSKNPQDPSRIVPGTIRIAEKYRNIADPRARGMAIGAILAHEVAHYCLMSKGILRDTADNERLTDLGLMLLGFGKLWFNGRNLVVEERAEQLGYLKPLDMTYAFMEFARLNHIPHATLRTGMSPEALQVFTFWLGSVSKEVRVEQLREAEEDAEKLRAALAADLAGLLEGIRKAVRDTETLQSSLDGAGASQEIINRSHHFWTVPPGDHTVMGAFVAACASGDYETGLAGIRQALHTLAREVEQLTAGIPPGTSLPDPAVPRNAVARCRENLAGLFGRIAALQQEAASVTAVHERCFATIGPVREDLALTRSTILRCKEKRGDIRSYHLFFTGNPVVWDAYTGNPALGARISQLTASGATDECLYLADHEAEELSTLLALPRHQYADCLVRLPPLAEIAGRARSGRDQAARSLAALEDTLQAQARVTSVYLHEALPVQSRLRVVLAQAPGIAGDISSLKARQDRIYAGHANLTIAPADEEVFARITRSVLSCSAEADYAACTRTLTGIQARLHGDIERVRGRFESDRILPAEQYRTEFTRAEEDLRKVGDRVRSWKQVQQPYLDQLDLLEQGPILTRVATRIRLSAQKLAGRRRP
jgi:hypothetical protein